MKRSAFSLKSKFQLLGANVRYSLLATFAYAGKNWGNLISTATYTLTYLAFLSFLFSNVDSVAGYSYGEMLFMLLVGQISFYSQYAFSENGSELLIDLVKRGDLDLILSKPVPSLWFLFTRGIEIHTLLVDGIPALIPVIILGTRNVDYSLTLASIALGAATMVTGLVATHCFTFIASLSVFALGEAKRIRLVAIDIQDIGSNLPFESFPKSIQKIGTTLLPILITVGLSTSYYLGKTTSIIPLLIVAATATVFLTIKQLAWQLALRNYTSASS